MGTKQNVRTATLGVFVVLVLKVIAHKELHMRVSQTIGNTRHRERNNAVGDVGQQETCIVHVSGHGTMGAVK